MKAKKIFTVLLAGLLATAAVVSASAATLTMKTQTAIPKLQLKSREALPER